MRKKVDLLGFPVDLVDMAGAIEMARDFLHSGEAHHVVTLNPEMIIQSRRDAQLKKALDDADAYLPETAGVGWALGVEKVPGIDFMYALLSLAAAEEYTAYFLGAKPGVVEKAAEQAAVLFPGVRIVGTRDGYFSADEEPALVDEIASKDPDILLIGMGVKAQEGFIARHKTELKSRIMMGVGGSFDVLSGTIERAPEAFRRANVEWLYRLLTQPQRFGRMASTLPHFAILVETQKIRRRLGRNGLGS